jgi:hypothetical protein
MLSFKPVVEVPAVDRATASKAGGRFNFDSSMSPKAQELRLRYEALQVAASRSMNSDLKTSQD